MTRRTPGRFRTRVLTEGVTPSLHIDYKHTGIKQYHKEGRALRIETTINVTRDFGIGKRLKNLPALRAIGFQANRRLLDVQRISHDCAVGEDAFRQVTGPIQVGRQRASALRFGDPCVLANCWHRSWCFVSCLGVVVSAICGSIGLHCWVKIPATMTPGRMTYQLRRLRLHGLIERQEGTHRYIVTDFGLRVSLFFTRGYAPSCARGCPWSWRRPGRDPPDLRRAFAQLEAAMDRHVAEAKMAS